MNEVIENVVPWIEILENTIHNSQECPSDFEETFCGGNQLLNVWFSSKEMFVVYLLSSGIKDSNTFTIQDFSDWLEKE
jgi:hypothetical protein